MQTVITQGLRRLRFTFREEKSGQSLVEFALVFTFVIVPFTLIFVETSIVLYQYVALTNAAREGARSGSIYLFVGDPAGSSAAPDTGRSTAVRDTVQDTVGPLIPTPPDCNGTSAATSCQITYGPPSSPLVPDPLRSTDMMTVTITHTHQLLFGAVVGSIDLSAASSMRIEPSTVITGP